MSTGKTKRLIFHIGAAKTGSSALQYYFACNRSLFESQSVLYYQPSRRYLPWQGQSNADFLLRSVLKELNSEHSLLGDLANSEAAANERSLIREELKLFAEKARQYETVILSEECFWGQGIHFPLLWPHLKDQLHDILGNSIKIDIVVYLRRQDYWLLSHWKEAVRGFHMDHRTFSEFSDWCQECGLLDYNSALLEIEAVFGHSNTIVRCYDKESFIMGSIITDFLSATSLPFQVEEEYRDIVVNPSYSMSLTEALRLINSGEIPCVASERSLRKAASILSQHELSTKAEYPLSAGKRTRFLHNLQDGNLMLSKHHKGLEPLLNCSFPPYEVYPHNSKRDRKNAIALSKFAEMIENNAK